MLSNKPLFNKIEDDPNLFEAYDIGSLDWTFIKSLYSIIRKMRYEHLFYEKNYRYSAEKVICRLITLLEWLDSEMSTTNNMYRTMLKETVVPGPWPTKLVFHYGP